MAEGNQLSLPAAPPNTPGFPASPWPILFHGFTTLNTKASRAGIGDQDMYICDGWMPLGENNIRTIPGLGTTLYVWDGANSISYFSFVSLFLPNGIFSPIVKPACLIFLGPAFGNSGCIQLDQQTGMTSVVIPLGDINGEGAQNISVAQWGNQYALIIASNGYWIWDGQITFTAGTLSPQATLTDPGSGYTGSPTITVRGGSGSGAALGATESGGSISSLKFTAPGAGYVLGDIPIITFTGGGSDDQAWATATISTDSGVSSVVVNNGGIAYSNQTSVAASGGGASVDATFTISGVGGVITSVNVVNPGLGYTSVPTLTVTDPTGSGSGAALTAVLSGGQISSVTVGGPGTNYTTTPQVFVIGDGAGAVLQATISGGLLTSIDVISGGFGYTQAGIQIEGGNNSASGLVSLMPFGIKGKAIAVYQDRVWIMNGNQVIFSSPGSASDFDVANGSGAFVSSDAFLRYSYVGMVATNGFLYLLGDSSINYISGVNTSGNPAITTFSNLNVDPQIGVHDPRVPVPQIGISGYQATAACIQLFSRNIVFTGNTGAYVSYGGAVTKISSPIDGLYGTATTLVQPSDTCFTSTAVANIYGVEVFMFIQTILDQYTGTDVNKIFMWDGKRWWTTDQDWPEGPTSPKFITSDTSFIAYYTDGHRIVPMFQAPTTGFQKTLQSKLWGSDSIHWTKTNLRTFPLFYNNVADTSVLSFYADSELGASAAATYPLSVTGLIKTQLPLTQFGSLAGMTLRTPAKDVTLVSITNMANLEQTLY